MKQLLAHLSILGAFLAFANGLTAQRDISATERVAAPENLGQPVTEEGEVGGAAAAAPGGRRRS